MKRRLRAFHRGGIAGAKVAATAVRSQTGDRAAIARHRLQKLLREQLSAARRILFHGLCRTSTAISSPPKPPARARAHHAPDALPGLAFQA